MPGGFRRRRARDEQRVRVDGNGLRRAVVGEAGLEDEELARRHARLDERAQVLERQRRAGFSTPPGAKTDLRRAVQLADEVKGSVTDVVVLASGDLGLGIRALAAALTPRAARAAESDTAAARLHVADRLDPEAFGALLAELDLAKTLFNVVDATGEALATMGHFLIVREKLLRELGAVEYQQRVVVTTRTAEGALRQIVNDEGFRLALPDAADEAAALLAPGALFPLACVGIDVRALLAGGAAMLERCAAHDDSLHPAHLVAVARDLAAPLGLRVAQPAADALDLLAAWIERRVAADLPTGAREGRRVALSIATAPPAHDLTIPKVYQDLDGVGYLGGRGLGEIAVHERIGDELTRWAAGELTIALTLPEIGAHALGQVVALTEAAVLLGRETADAPSPHDGRRLVYGLAGRPGYEAERAGAQRVTARREDRYVA